jgi:hypothetical protein
MLGRDLGLDGELSARWRSGPETIPIKKTTPSFMENANRVSPWTLPPCEVEEHTGVSPFLQARKPGRGDRRGAEQLPDDENGREVYRVSEARQASHHRRRVQNIGSADHEVSSRGKSRRESVNRLLCLVYSAVRCGYSVTPLCPPKSSMYAHRAVSLRAFLSDSNSRR